MPSHHFIKILFLILLFSCPDLGHQLAIVRRGEADGVINNCINNERQALLSFKADIEDPYGELSTWRAKDDCCEWNGVTCNNHTGHVIRLDLSDLFLIGEIGPSLLNLTYLSHLDLGGNAFYGTIPKFIGSMTKLTYPNLMATFFNGTIPNFIGSLTKLRNLSIGSNLLKGTIPESIGSLKELRKLRISGDSLHGTFPSKLGNLTNLQYLYLSGGKLTVENLEWLSHLSHLQELTMFEVSLAKANRWVDIILSLPKLSYLSFFSCNLSQVTSPYSSFHNSSSSIATLHLFDNNLDSSAYAWLFLLSSNRLVHLDLSGNMLDRIPKYFRNLCSLEILDMESNILDVEFPYFIKTLSGCTSNNLKWLYVGHNQLTGSLPDEIQMFSSLEDLDLFHNQLNGTLSEKLWELPKLEYLDVGLNSLTGATSKNIVKSKLQYIDLSNNLFETSFFEVHMSSLLHLDHIYLRSCKVGPGFPQWIQTMKNLTYLDISNSGISGTIPMSFWDTWPSQLKYMNLSSNNISGEVLDLSSIFGLYSSIDLSSNKLYGAIPNVPSTLVSLNLSRNKFYGGISFLCQITDGALSFLDLSSNSLSGPLPDCLGHFKELKVLNLAKNNLYGRLPASMASLIQLEVLYLYHNNFSGELPLALKNCTKLNFVNFGDNNFSGNVPVWIGEKLSDLHILSLRSNNLIGHIPLQLCQLVHLQVLDMSMNNLHGSIPSCLNNITTMVHENISLGIGTHEFSVAYTAIVDHGRIIYRYDHYIDYALIMWQGNEREFNRKNLELLTYIDLSGNNLVGQIPDELIDLQQLLALNLSNNALYGELPQKIGNMKKLLILDLSRNNFSGKIPSSMSGMTFLGYLDLSNNNMSGRIPTSTQLQSFDPSRYTGNVGLCGPPVTKNCPGDKTKERQLVVGETRGVGKETVESQIWFYIGGGIGFPIGFWTSCGVLLVNRRGRHIFFRSLDILEDWFYTSMAVFIARLR